MVARFVGGRRQQFDSVVVSRHLVGAPPATSAEMATTRPHSHRTVVVVRNGSRQ